MLGSVHPRFKRVKPMIRIGLDRRAIALDNYERVFAGIDIVSDSRSLNNIEVLIEQLYNAEVYIDNYDNYMNDLITRIATKYFDGDYNKSYVEEMRKSRDKVLTLVKKYQSSIE